MDLHAKAPPPRETDPLLHAAARWLIATHPQADLIDPQETIAWRSHQAVCAAPAQGKGRDLAEELALLTQYKVSLERPRQGKCPAIQQQLEQVKAALEARMTRLAAIQQLQQ